MSKILCIEDEPDLRSELVEELSYAGFETLEATNGVDGIGAIVEHHPDLVICDCLMPGLTGSEVFRKLRTEHPELQTMPFIFLSANAEKDQIEAGIQLGADHYLTKPVDLDALLEIVGRHVTP